VVGGVVHIPTPDERKGLLKKLQNGDKILMAIWKLFKDSLLKKEQFMNLGSTATHHLALTNNGGLEFYDGELTLMNPEGDITNAFSPDDYFDYVTEEEQDHSYMKFPILKTGEKLRVGPLARINIAKGCGTPKADSLLQEAKELLGFPTNTTMAFHVARLVETMFAWERAVKLLGDDDVSSSKALGGGYPPQAGDGIGIVEAPRGTLVHHYVFNEKGRLEDVDFVVATQHNNHAINDDLTATAQESVTMAVTEDILNRLEMIPRAYDPCLACATHCIDERPFGITLRAHDGKILRRW
jgi:F420-non-reducing hydrogenase large subunit